MSSPLISLLWPEETYRMMKGEMSNQCVIISGESGAGKTESAKLIMKYVAAVSGSSQGVEYVKSVILESNPLLEAFGNAKTLRNNNSSRFGKYFEIKFDRKGDPSGGRITNYLLEKSRVVVPQPGERTFHVFYQLIAGADQQMRDAFALWGPGNISAFFYFHFCSIFFLRNFFLVILLINILNSENYGYLYRSGTYSVDGINDVQDYAEVCHAMTVMEIPADRQWRIWQLVATIMHVGNIQFKEDAKGSAQCDQQTLEVPIFFSFIFCLSMPAEMYSLDLIQSLILCFNRVLRLSWKLILSLLVMLLLHVLCKLEEWVVVRPTTSLRTSSKPPLLVMHWPNLCMTECLTTLFRL